MRPPATCTMRPTRSPRPHRRAALVIAATAVALGALAPVASSSPRPEGPAVEAAGAAGPAVALAPPSPSLPGLPPVSLALSAVPVDSSAFRRATSAYRTAADAFAQHQAHRAGIDQALSELRGQQASVEAELTAARARRAAVTSRLDDLTGAIADLGVALYLSGGGAARLDAALTDEQPSINAADRRQVFGDASLDVLLAERTVYRERLDEAEARVAEATSLLKEIRSRREALRADRPVASAAEVGAAPAVAARRVAYEHARVLATVSGVEFPLVALDAYYRAARSSAQEDPGCGVGWWAIAGISRVEGHHGTYGGASLDERGDATRRIIGIQLNGTNNTQVVRDSDGGALDGDPAYDRAVGPMQFIPQTWQRFAADGNADLVATPFNLYDATLAAARYLCRASRGLADDSGLRSAYFSYNHSVEYVERVLSFARGYQRVLDIPALSD